MEIHPHLCFLSPLRERIRGEGALLTGEGIREKVPHHRGEKAISPFEKGGLRGI
jgi:hypothetical protein